MSTLRRVPVCVESLTMPRVRRVPAVGAGAVGGELRVGDRRAPRGSAVLASSMDAFYGFAARHAG